MEEGRVQSAAVSKAFDDERLLEFTEDTIEACELSADVRLGASTGSMDSHTTATSPPDCATFSTIKADIEKLIDLDMKRQDGCDGEDSASLSDLDTVGSRDSLEDEGWLFLLGHNMLKKKVLKAGGGVSTQPVHGDLVTVSYLCTLDCGQQVDSNAGLKFSLGDGDVIQAIDLAVALMQLGECALVITEAKYAYGELGKEPSIPSNARLTYNLQLLSVEDSPVYSTLPLNQILELGNLKRERGNFLYARNEHGAAINSYSRALAILAEGDGKVSRVSPQGHDLSEMKLKCHNNLAAAQLKVEAWDVAIKSCDSVLLEEPENTKALFRKGKCLAGKGDITEAVSLLRKALKIEPQSKLIHHELSHLVSRQKLEDEASRLVYQRMLGATQATQTDSPTAAELPTTAMTSEWVLYIVGAAAVATVALCFATYFSLY